MERVFNYNIPELDNSESRWLHSIPDYGDDQDGDYDDDNVDEENCDGDDDDDDNYDGDNDDNYDDDDDFKFLLLMIDESNYWNIVTEIMIKMSIAMHLC